MGIINSKTDRILTEIRRKYSNGIITRYQYDLLVEKCKKQYDYFDNTYFENFDEVIKEHEESIDNLDFKFNYFIESDDNGEKKVSIINRIIHRINEFINNCKQKIMSFINKFKNNKIENEKELNSIKFKVNTHEKELKDLEIQRKQIEDEIKKCKQGKGDESRIQKLQNSIKNNKNKIVTGVFVTASIPVFINLIKSGKLINNYEKWESQNDVSNSEMKDLNLLQKLFLMLDENAKLTMKINMENNNTAQKMTVIANLYDKQKNFFYSKQKEILDDYFNKEERKINNEMWTKTGQVFEGIDLNDPDGVEKCMEKCKKIREETRAKMESLRNKHYL